MSFDRKSPRSSGRRPPKPRSKDGAKTFGLSKPKAGARARPDRARGNDRLDLYAARKKTKPAVGKKFVRDKDRDRALTDPEKKQRRVLRKKRGPWQETAYAVTVDPAEVAKKRKPVPSTIEPAEAGATPAPAPDGKERLQKVLARCGVASRRNAELLILEGNVTVNGRPVVELGTKVDPTKDKIKVNGTLIYTEVEPIYIALYKPKGMISSLVDPEGRRHIGHILNSIRERVIPIGRLDYNSEGLLLLTNDGTLAERILKARELPKVYMVKVKGHPTDRDLDFLKRGFFTAEGVVRFASYGVEQALKSKSWIKLEVTEGSRLDLREMLNHKGLLVDRIVRTAIGSVSIQGLEPGEYRFLKRTDFERLLTFAKD
ncbi:MAG: rRNA pseudouridine synthase [Deltaproteobacteria bacterium]|nr:rRNA pseudouridine synthase [Deltaproteobacteria bacterium]